MEKLLDLTKLLKGCPLGMPLDCTIHHDVIFKCVLSEKAYDYPISIETRNGYTIRLTKYGQYTILPDAKCVIFPKGKTTWEGFQRPFVDEDIEMNDLYRPFVDGDIVMAGVNRFAIFKRHIKHYGDEGNLIDCYLYYNDEEDSLNRECSRCVAQRLATEKEKERLFKVIKNWGYKWNDNTKTLEKLDSIVNKQTIDTKNSNNLYLENRSDRFTIENPSENPKFKGKITINWDPHGGLYFSGLESDLAILADLISENTILSEI